MDCGSGRMASPSTILLNKGIVARIEADIYGFLATTSASLSAEKCYPSVKSFPVHRNSRYFPVERHGSRRQNGNVVNVLLRISPQLTFTFDVLVP